MRNVMRRARRLSYELLDRPGGRRAAGVIATWELRRHGGGSVRWVDSQWLYDWAGEKAPTPDLLHRGGRPYHTAAEWATLGRFDLADVFFWDYTPGRGDVVVDVGAGLGGETLKLAGMVGPAGRVFAIEAHPTTFGRLRRLCEVNAWAHVVPIHVAVADRPGTLTMSDEEQDIHNNVFNPGKISVPADTLDRIADEHGIDRVDWLKMNIEGAERLAVEGAERLIDRTTHVWISCHDFKGVEWARSRDVVEPWLTEHGFSIRTRPDDPRPWVRQYLYGRRN